MGLLFFVCFELIPKCDSTVLSTNGKAEKPSRKKMINEVSLSPSQNPYHSPFLHKSIPLLCFLSLNGPPSYLPWEYFFYLIPSKWVKLTLSHHQACLLTARRNRCPWKIIGKWECTWEKHSFGGGGRNTSDTNGTCIHGNKFQKRNA